jgi:hypothetical protein
MILVRMVFQVKWGRMDELLAQRPKMEALRAELGLGKMRVMTDLGGPMFTFVQEAEVDSIEQWQQQSQAMFSNPRWQEVMANMPDVFESGRTEFYTILDT